MGILLYLASLKLSRGWLAGWVVGKSDFNENPVVSLDLDFGLRLRVCQFQIIFGRYDVSVDMSLYYFSNDKALVNINLQLVDIDQKLVYIWSVLTKS